MPQVQITRRHRAASAHRRGEIEQLLPLDPRDPDITRAKQLQRRSEAERIISWRAMLEPSQ